MSIRPRIVVKVGTNVITTEAGLLDESVLRSLTDQITELSDAGTDLILVSSGAMAAGRAAVTLSPSLGNVARRQVLASVGQARLMEVYGRLFAGHKRVCAQVLATKEDFRDRQHYLNMRDCFTSLLSEHVIPVVNENDAISVSELMFTDNDELAGLIASMMDAEALILLTSVDGIYTGKPGEPGSELIGTIDGTREWKSYLRAEKSSFGRGGMHTKCRTAEKLADLGIRTHIANGKAPDVLRRLMKGEAMGTTFTAKRGASSVKRWVAGSEGQEKGSVVINICAEERLKDRSKVMSLLPVGVTGIEGEFEKGDVVRIRGEGGKDIGLGIAQMSSGAARECMGKKNQKALIHYDYLFLTA